MTKYDMDSDVFRWGLHHLLDVCTPSNSGSPSITTRYDPDASRVEYVREGFCQNTDVENDEAVALAYQEELSRLDSMEASGLSNSENEHMRASIIAQNWPSSSIKNYDFANDTDQKAIDEPNNMKDVEYCRPSEKENGVVHDIEISRSSFGSEEIPASNEISWQSLEISNEFALDGEVGKRINQMVPIPHVPKTNEKFPSDDEEISDHQRLLDRLQLYYLIERKVEGDGNCQFRALSDQLHRSSEHHKSVREQIIQQLKYYPELYAGYVPMKYGEYLKKMSKTGEWGDHVTLQAAADWAAVLLPYANSAEQHLQKLYEYGVKIFVITSFKDTCYIEILPQMKKSGRVIFLSFWAEVHYNSIYPEGELPTSCEKKKKNKWYFSGLGSMHSGYK